LAVIFVQHERHKYPRALPRLIEAISALREVETLYVVVDNAKPGNWSHQVSAALFHIGGDNRSWEFSAFDRGARWLESQSWSADLLLFATDALLAYGDGFLELIDERVINACLTQSACVGWIDSFMESSRILDHDYDSWIRTSLIFMPVAVERRLGSMAWPLDDTVLFGPGPEQPFHPSAPVSTNLQANLLSWLTREADDGQLDEVWHSQFFLDTSTFSLFKAKAKAILREHLLSARLLRLEVPCFDLRALRLANAHGIKLKSLHGPTGQHWQWLGWRSIGPPKGQREEPSSAAADALAAPSEGPVFVLDCGQNPASLKFIRQIVKVAMPDLWQRCHGSRLVIVGDADSREMRQLQDPGKILIAAADESATDTFSDATAFIVPQPLNDRAAAALERATAHGIPTLGREATEPLEIARACYQLIQDAAHREQLEQAAQEQAARLEVELLDGPSSPTPTPTQDTL